MRVPATGVPAPAVPDRLRWSASFRALSRPAQLLVVNDLAINVGFYMVLPFLAMHLRDDLGYGAAAIGLLLGLRTLSQQGMFLFGGAAADRIGCRPMIIAGCGLRVVAFGLFAMSTSLPGVVTATVLTGLASALFNPALRTYLTHETRGHRAEAFAVLNVASHTGALLGPLLGGLLLFVSFRLVALVACGVFAVLTVGQVLLLPDRPVTRQERGVLGSWGDVLRNRRFLAFAGAGSMYFALYNQIYLTLPLEAERATGLRGSVSLLFVVSTLVVIVVQLRVTTALRSRWQPGVGMASGLALMGLGFLPVVASTLWLPTGPGAGALSGLLLAAAPVLLGTVVFSVGIAATFPFVMQLLPMVGSERLVGTYYGVFYLVSGVSAAAVSWLAGGLLDLQDPTLRWTAPAALTVLGLAGAAAIATMQRRGSLT